MLKLTLRPANQEICGLLRNQKVNYRVYKSLPSVPTLIQINTIHAIQVLRVIFILFSYFCFGLPNGPLPPGVSASILVHIGVNIGLIPNV
jgi:hypothetical protein